MISRYDIILFDVDDTLLDFRKSERAAFDLIMAEHFPTTDEVFVSYREINRDLWRQYERGEIVKTTIPHTRFRQLGEVWKKTWDPHAMGQLYMDHLAEQRHLLPDAAEICASLAKHATLGLVTNGIATVQHSRLNPSPITPFMSVIVVSEECGHAKPDARIFQHALSRLPPADPERVLVVGDRVDVDVRGARAAGLKSCWFNPDALSDDTEPAPDFEIRSLAALLPLVLEDPTTGKG